MRGVARGVVVRVGVWHNKIMSIETLLKGFIVVFCFVGYKPVVCCLRIVSFRWRGGGCSGGKGQTEEGWMYVCMAVDVEVRACM